MAERGLTPQLEAAFDASLGAIIDAMPGGVVVVAAGSGAIVKANDAATRFLGVPWDVLSTLTPFDYASFRDKLQQSSGFQSYQYRKLEFLLGNKNAALIEVHRGQEDVYRELERALHAPSVYDETLRLLARRGFDVPESRTERDWAEPYEPDPGVEAAWLEVYRDVTTHWDLYELAEKLVDVEDNFHQWRFRHMKTVERVIGYKRGTGGTSGVGYLRKALDLRFFPELWTVRTSI